MSKVIIINVKEDTLDPSEIMKQFEELYNTEIDPNHPVVISPALTTYPQFISCSS